MRDGQPLVVECLVAKYQKIQVKCARAPVPVSLPPVSLLNRLKLIEQGMRRKLSTKPYRAVYKVWLVLWAHRTTGVKRRLCDKRGLGQHG